MLIRKAQELSIEVKSMAVFAGVVVVGLAVLPFEPGAVTLPPMAGWLLVALIGAASYIFILGDVKRMEVS